MTRRAEPMALVVQRKLTRVERREIALAALVDERTLCRALDGQPVVGLCYERIRQALRSRGLERTTGEPGAAAKASRVGKVAALRPALMRDKDAAAYLGRSASWIRSLRAADVRAMREWREPTGPAWIVVSRSSVLYRVDALDAWIEANAQERGVVLFSNRGGEVSK